MRWLRCQALVRGSAMTSHAVNATRGNHPPDQVLCDSWASIVEHAIMSMIRLCQLRGRFREPRRGPRLELCRGLEQVATDAVANRLHYDRCVTNDPLSGPLEVAAE